MKKIYKLLDEVKKIVSVEKKNIDPDADLEDYNRDVGWQEGAEFVINYIFNELEKGDK